MGHLSACDAWVRIGENSFVVSYRYLVTACWQRLGPGTGWSDVAQTRDRPGVVDAVAAGWPVRGDRCPTGPDPSDHDSSADVDDATLVAASIGDVERFAEVYDRHASAMYGFAVRRLGPEVAEDVVADAILAAFKARRSYKSSYPSALPWLLGILTREISSRRRSERARYRALSRVMPDLPVEAVADRVVASVTAEALGGCLAAGLARLAGRDRDVLLLIAWADLSYAEVAEALGIPIGTVRSRLSRARRILRAALPDPSSDSAEGSA